MDAAADIRWKQRPSAGDLSRPAAARRCREVKMTPYSAPIAQSEREIRAPEIFEGVVDKVADEVTKDIDYVRKLWANT